MQKLKNKNSLYSNNQIIAWLFVSPFVIGILSYFAYAIYSSLAFSFSDVSVGDTSYNLINAGMANYKYAFKGDLNFLKLLISNVTSVIYRTPMILIFSLLMAVFLNQKLPCRTMYRAIFFLPVIVSSGIVAASDSSNAVLQTLTSSSTLNIGTGANAGIFSAEVIENYFATLNFSPTLISYVTNAVDSIIDIVNQSGVQIIIFLAGLQSISPSIYEYAKTEGATGWEIFWKITFPLIGPMMLVNLFYTVVDAVTGSTNAVLSYIRTISFTNAKFGEASAMAWIYFLVIASIIAIVATIIVLYIRKRNRVM